MDLIYEDRESLAEVEGRYLKGYPHFKNTLHISAVYEEGLSDVKVPNKNVNECTYIDN
jgi:hypothetical protein